MRSNGKRLVCGVVAPVLLVLAGCSPFPPPDPVPPPRGSAVGYTETPLCVVDLTATRGLRMVTAYAAANGGLFLLEGNRYQPLGRRYPESREGGYAGAEDWFRKGEPIRQYGERYLKHGPNRVVPAAALTLGAPHQGVPVFLDRNDLESPAVLYIPVRPGCVFQPYAAERFSSAR
jgi:hypothetical protein